MAPIFAIIRYALLETFFCIPILPKTPFRCLYSNETRIFYVLLLDLGSKSQSPHHIRSYHHKGKEEQKSSVIFQNAVMVSIIRGIMPEWKAGEKFSIAGQYSKDDKAVIFDLNTAKPYWRRDPKKNAE